MGWDSREGCPSRLVWFTDGPAELSAKSLKPGIFWGQSLSSPTALFHPRGPAWEERDVATWAFHPDCNYSNPQVTFQSPKALTPEGVGILNTTLPPQAIATITIVSHVPDVAMMVSFSFYLFIYLGCSGSQLRHMRSLLQQVGVHTHVVSSSPTRDRTQAPCIGSTESYPLDHQGSPNDGFFLVSF